MNLINLCLGSPFCEPASFAFSSSISCRQGSRDETCSEGFSTSPSTAAGMGYAQSKWVVEKLCEHAAQKSGVPVSVLRIGQMVGDSVQWVAPSLRNECTLIFSFEAVSGTKRRHGR